VEIFTKAKVDSVKDNRGGKKVVFENRGWEAGNVAQKVLVAVEGSH